MLFFNGKQLFEGIDSIEVLLQPCLSRFFNFNIQLDPHNLLSLYSRKSFIPNDNGGAVKFHNYLHISGEMINPDLNILDTIAKAVSMLIERKKISIYDIWRNDKYPIVSLEFIRNNLSLFITGITLVEFCFDFKEKDIQISKYANVLDVEEKEKLADFLKKKLNGREDCIIVNDETTVYSKDYNNKYKRKSTLKLYDREKRLLIKKTEYPADFIKNNPYKKRIEFVLQKGKSSYFNLPNFDGNYHEIMERFIPYLAKKYREYFLNKILVNTVDYHYFDQIYTMAQWDKIPGNKELKSNNKLKRHGRKLNSMQIVSELINKLRKEERKKERKRIKAENDKIIEMMRIKELSDNYFINLDKVPYHTPLDIKDETVIDKELSDDNFTFYKNDFITPLLLRNEYE